MKGIDKGDILSSGAPQITKDGPAGRNTGDMQSRRPKFGTWNFVLKLFKYCCSVCNTICGVCEQEAEKIYRILTAIKMRQLMVLKVSIQGSIGVCLITFEKHFISQSEGITVYAVCM